MSDQVFLMDDFFVGDADPGVEVVVPFRGRSVPMTLKRGITLSEKEQAVQAAIKRHITAEGKVVIDGVDDALLSQSVIAAYVKVWPFAVPVSLEAAARLDSSFAEAILEVIKARQTAREAEASGPFAPVSAEDSALPVPPPSSSPQEVSASASVATSDSTGLPTPSLA